MPLLTVFRAEVVDNKDPEKQGRLKLRVPDLTGDNEHDYWTPPKGMINSRAFGLYAIPGIGDMVFVEFEAGDARFPIWSYSVKPKGEAFDRAYDDSGAPTKVVLQSRSGQVVEIDDEAKTITIEHSSGGKVVLNDSHISIVKDAISLGSQDGSAQPAVKGDDNADRLTDLTDALNDFLTALQTDIAASSGSPYLVFANMLVQVPILKVKLQAVKQLIPQTKSTKVTLD